MGLDSRGDLLTLLVSKFDYFWVKKLKELISGGGHLLDAEQYLNLTKECQVLHHCDDNVNLLKALIPV